MPPNLCLEESALLACQNHRVRLPTNHRSSPNSSGSSQTDCRATDNRASSGAARRGSTAIHQSTRYGLTGIAALALLAWGHWLRDQPVAPAPLGDYLLGVVPNFAAALAITFVLLGIWSDQKRDAGFAATRRAFLACMAITAAGLVAWEFFRMSSERLVFDPHDLGATLVGLGLAAALFAVLTPRGGGASGTD